MEKLLKKLSEMDNEGWTVFEKTGEGPETTDKRMTLEEGAPIHAREDTMNTIAAISQLPECAVLVITKEENLAALNAAMELYASAKHFGHEAEMLLLRRGEADAQTVAERCKEIVLKWQEDLLSK